jgi:hypothetical protein
VEHQFGPIPLLHSRAWPKPQKPAPTPGARLSVAGSARASDMWGSFVSSNSTESTRAHTCHVEPARHTPLRRRSYAAFGGPPVTLPSLAPGATALANSAASTPPRARQRRRGRNYLRGFRHRPSKHPGRHPRPI